MTKDLLTLTKARIALMSVVTAWLGFSLAGGKGPLALLLLSTALSAGSCGALNQLIERREDGLMNRTRLRPLPSARMTPQAALRAGLLLAALGLAAAWAVNPSTFRLTAAALALYLLAYTPLKKVSPHATWVGAAAGAMPPLIGWAAAAGGLSPRAWILFGIQFLWQIPHFLAMFWLHREDYRRAGFRVMPVVDPRGGLTAFQIALHSFTLLPASLLPSLCGMAGPRYGLAALVMGTGYMALGLRASWTLAAIDTRRLFLASLAYLPILFGMLVIGGA